MFLIPAFAYGGSAEWNLNPTSGDWNTAANWTPMTVPNGPADVATFALSNTTNVSISADTEVNGITFTSAATNPYTITTNPELTLTISGVGITNNSGIAQRLFINPSFDFNPGEIVFTHSASAGNVNIVSEGGLVQFSDRSTAGSATIFTDGLGFGGGFVTFSDTSTADNAEIIGLGIGSGVTFSDHSTAAGAGVQLGDEGGLVFRDQSSAGNATIFGAFL
jgi:hypothetical protein